MVVGALGDVVFSVSSRYVKTLENFNWSGSARYSNHQLAAGNTVTEYTGCDPESITFDVTLSRYLGVSPMTEIQKITNYRVWGAALPLTLGSHVYGRYRWVIKSQKVKAETFDGHGNIMSATLSLTLQEYLR